MTLKIQVDGQDDKNNEHTGMKNVCSYFFFFFLTFVATGPHCHEMKC